MSFVRYFSPGFSFEVFICHNKCGLFMVSSGFCRKVSTYVFSLLIFSEMRGKLIRNYYNIQSGEGLRLYLRNNWTQRKIGLEFVNVLIIE